MIRGFFLKRSISYKIMQNVIFHVKLLSPTLSRLFSCIIITSDTLRLQLHGAIYRPDSFVMILRYCANLKAIRYESTSLNRIAADKSHRVIVA